MLLYQIEHAMDLENGGKMKKTALTQAISVKDERHTFPKSQRNFLTGSFQALGNSVIRIKKTYLIFGIVSGLLLLITGIVTPIVILNSSEDQNLQLNTTTLSPTTEIVTTTFPPFNGSSI